MLLISNTMVDNLAQGVTSFTSNVFFVPGEEPALVDVGANFDIVKQLRERSVPKKIVITHTHPDHVRNLSDVQSEFDIDTYGFDGSYNGINHEIKDGQTITLGDHTYEVAHTPGHKNDHVCLYASQPGILFGGDLVFQNGSFGRTDLEEGDRSLLIESINRIAKLVEGDLSELHPGHGPSISNEPYDHITLAGQMAQQR